MSASNMLEPLEGSKGKNSNPYHRKDQDGLYTEGTDKQRHIPTSPPSCLLSGASAKC